ncbi:MAG: cell wall-associated protease [Saprospiraceae bacterium]|jgi:cell wall-associated protease
MSFLNVVRKGLVKTVLQNKQRNMKIKFTLIAAIVFAASSVFAQDKPAQDWFLKSPTKDNVQGVSIEETYNTILKGQKGKTVIVAVIDSGIDYDHEDLKDVMWVNKDEIAGDGIDNDKNGYVDDIHGWNFIGGKDGSNVDSDNLEVARVYKHLQTRFQDQKEGDIKGKKNKAEFARYIRAQEEIESTISKNTEAIVRYNRTLDVISKAEKAIGKEDITIADLDELKTDDEKLQRGILGLKNFMSNFSSMKETKGYLHNTIEYFQNSLDYNYNPDFDPRSSIVKDNYADSSEKGYGNNIYDGPDAFHGTHVAGIIGATRNNEIGMNGVADNVSIMTIRAVPNGDERDKDVANAILYAVDNGAQIINMSFGKSFSWDKQAVDKAVKYALKNDVLLVHAAGNSKKDNDSNDNFPNDKYAKKGLFSKKKASNWMEIGALDWKGGEKSTANFSNYGKNNVDVFAPGVDIYATTPDDNYQAISGTSMAAPVVSGVAAVLLSYYPDLTATQVKEIIMQSVDPIAGKVRKPGTKETVNFSELAVSGGSVNALKAVKLAEKTKGKRKGVTRPVKKDRA